MSETPLSDIFTRRVCLQLDGMNAVTVRRDVAYRPPDPHRRFDLYYPTDAVTIAAVVAIITAVATIACGLPAWRASRLDPIVVLRAD